MGIITSLFLQTSGFPSLSVRGFEVELNKLSNKSSGVHAGKESLFLEGNDSRKDSTWWLSSARRTQNN
jgi:hypothetical protein